MSSLVAGVGGAEMAGGGLFGRTPGREEAQAALAVRSIESKLKELQGSLDAYNKAPTGTNVQRVKMMLSAFINDKEVKNFMSLHLGGAKKSKKSKPSSKKSASKPKPSVKKSASKPKPSSKKSVSKPKPSFKKSASKPKPSVKKSVSKPVKKSKKPKAAPKKTFAWW